MLDIKLAKVDMKPATQILKEKGIDKGGRVQKYIDSEVLRLCAPYVPFDDGALQRSGIDKTKIGSGVVIYDTPYARRWYYREANFKGAPKRGKMWFERMKNNGGKAKILAGVKKIVGRGSK